MGGGLPKGVGWRPKNGLADHPHYLLSKGGTRGYAPKYGVAVVPAAATDPKGVGGRTSMVEILPSPLGKVSNGVRRMR